MAVGDGVKLTEADEIIRGLWNQFSHVLIDGRGRAWQGDAAQATLDEAGYYLRKRGIGQWDHHGFMRAPHLDHHRCPRCRKRVSPGMWDVKARRCYDCQRMKEEKP